MFGTREPGTGIALRLFGTREVGHTDGRTHGHNNRVRVEPVPGIVLRLFGTREPGTGIALRLFGTREGGLVSMIGEVPTRSTP